MQYISMSIKIIDSSQFGGIHYDNNGNLYLDFSDKFYLINSDLNLLDMNNTKNKFLLTQNEVFFKTKKIIPNFNEKILQKKISNDLGKHNDDYLIEDELFDCDSESIADDQQDYFVFYGNYPYPVDFTMSEASYDSYIIEGDETSKKIVFSSKKIGDFNSIRITLYTNGIIRYNAIGDSIKMYKIKNNNGELVLQLC